MYKHSNYRGPRREKERVWENFWRNYSWKFSQHGKGNNQVQEVQRIPYRINPRRNTPRHILIKLTKTRHKERILKAAREKQQVIYEGNPIRLTADLSAETAGQKEWQDIFKAMRGTSTTKITVPGKDLIQNWWRNKKLFWQAKVKRIQYQQPALQQMFKGFIQSRNTREEKRSTRSTPNS